MPRDLVGQLIGCFGHAQRRITNLPDKGEVRGLLRLAVTTFKKQKG
jgi:hypothetical protein